MCPTLALAFELISQQSISPNDAGCQEILIGRLQALGFHIKRLPAGNATNFWSRHGTSDPVLAFAGHTDIVPPGPDGLWLSPPFKPTVRNGWLYGRGAADMKGPLAAWVTAVERFLADHPFHRGSIGTLITSAEESARVNGTQTVVEHLLSQGQTIKWCIVGEPSAKNVLGDQLKIGYRGSLSGKLLVRGVQGHVAYPQAVINPIHKVAPALHELVDTKWDQGNAFFPPTSLQITDINAGEQAGNVVPSKLDAHLNFRFCPEVTPDELQRRVTDILVRNGVDYSLSWEVDIEPFLSPAAELVEVARTVIRSVCSQEARLSTEGGTSDAGFVARTGAQVVELGPCTATMHQPNECIGVDELRRLSSVYEEILKQLLL